MSNWLDWGEITSFLGLDCKGFQASRISLA